MSVTLSKHSFKILFITGVSICFGGVSEGRNSDLEVEVVCPEKPKPIPKLSRSKTYNNTPFKAGEEARYELKYGAVAVHVGYGFMRVGKPIKYKIPAERKGERVLDRKYWHRVFSVEAYTGDWYKSIFQGYGRLQAFSRPWDSGISKFYLAEGQKKPFSDRKDREKWLSFDHVRCQATFKEDVKHKNKIKEEKHALMPGAIDALGAVYKLRTLELKKGVPEKFLVYTSEKNWWLEARPVEVEMVEVKAGTFKAVKVDLRTTVGEDLEQKGAMTMWIATDHPNRPLIKVEGEAKFGSYYLELDKFPPGS